MKKRFSTLLLSIVLCLALAVPAFASASVAASGSAGSGTITVSATGVAPGTYMGAVWKFKDASSAFSTADAEVQAYFNAEIGSDGRLPVTTIPAGYSMAAGDKLRVVITEGAFADFTVSGSSGSAPSGGGGGGGGGGGSSGSSRSSVGGKTTTVTKSFTDVPSGAYYASAVAWAVANGITNGTSDTTFSPNASCTRAQMVTFLWRAAGAPEPSGTSSKFTDVADGQYYTKAVRWAVEQGITNGTGVDTFSPNDTVNRAQAVTFLFRFAKAAAGNGANPFTDVAANQYYADAVAWAVANGITNGTSGTTFSPADACLRGQIVTFLYRHFVK